MLAAGGLAGAVALALFAGPAGADRDRSGPARAATHTDAARDGSFGRPFAEPTIGTGSRRVRTKRKCVTRRGGFRDCKPTAGALNVLPDRRQLYWDNLAGTENVEASIAFEYGVVSINDQSRVLDLRGGKRRWARPSPVDGGANGGPREPEPLLPSEDFRTNENRNDGSLFCADQNFLPDGRVLATGGTKYANDPGNDQSKFGSTELYGIRNARIFDPRTNRWTQTGSMRYGRWYPAMVTLGDGRSFVASGVRRLIKPIDRTQPQRSGRNVAETETFDPRTGRWRENGPGGERSLPLFPRLHLLPNGHVFYNAAGQAFNPAGQSIDEALWNVAASYNPRTRRWRDLGVPGLGTTAPGFRGSTFSVMLPLRPTSGGRYREAEFLTAGGVPNPPSPGGYFATRDSTITSVDTARGNRLTSRQAGPLAPTSSPAAGRWYSSGTLLPTGEVLATSGADRDEVVTPGSEIPVQQAELFDPRTETWRRVATARRSRTYHNTAVLLPDARVLVGGHAPISTGYGRNETLPAGVTAPNDGRDPTFEIYRPPYLSCGEQTRITAAPRSAAHGRRVTIETNTLARGIESAVLVRNPTQTHVVDADQRNVELRIVRRSGHKVTVALPRDGAVAPPGPYMLFVNRRTPRGCLIPSVSRQVRVGASAERAEPRFTG